jgi:hypothetical protein
MFTSEDTTYYYQAKETKDIFLWRRLLKDDFKSEKKKKKWECIPERKVPEFIKRQANSYFTSRFYGDMTNLLR